MMIGNVDGLMIFVGRSVRKRISASEPIASVNGRDAGLRLNEQVAEALRAAAARSHFRAVAEFE